MNPNPVFKVRPLFDAKYITNGYRYGHSYYRRRIGNRTQYPSSVASEAICKWGGHIKKISFSNRVVDKLNSLTDACVNCITVNNFNKNLAIANRSRAAA